MKSKQPSFYSGRERRRMAVFAGYEKIDSSLKIITKHVFCCTKSTQSFFKLDCYFGVSYVLSVGEPIHLAVHVKY